MPNNYNIDELPGGTFPITFQITYRCQKKYLILIAKHKCAKYKTDFFMEAGILSSLKYMRIK